MTLWSRVFSESLSRSLRPNVCDYPKLIEYSRGPQLSSVEKIRSAVSNEDRRTMFSTSASHFEIVDKRATREFVQNLMPGERNLLYEVLRQQKVEQYYADALNSTAEVHHDDLVAIYWINYIPFMVYGCLDNVVMIIAGEWFDKKVGLYMGISIMAAAAIGNIASNVMGIGMLHYVETIVKHFGIRNPFLNVKQMNNMSVRVVTYFSRVLGLLSGCILGMAPLLLYDAPERAIPLNFDAVENEEENEDLEIKENSPNRTFAMDSSENPRTKSETVRAEYERFHSAWKELTRKEEVKEIGMFTEIESMDD